MKKKRKYVKRGKYARKVKNQKSGVGLHSGIGLAMEINNAYEEFNKQLYGEKIEVFKSDYENMKKEIQKLKDFIVKKAMEE